MRVIWLTGKTCVGKSTWSEELKRRTPEARILHLGKLCRAKFGEVDMAASTNPVTPTETEAAVRDAIRFHLAALQEGETLIVDSFPRSVDQILWLKEIQKKHDTAKHEVVYAVCNEDVRQGRIDARSKDPVDATLIRARLALEDPVFLQIIGFLLTSGLKVSIINLATGETLTPRDSNQTNLDYMFAAHMEFVNETMRGLPSQMSLSDIQDRARVQRSLPPLHPAVVWLARYLTQTKREIEEAIADIPDKWWAVDKVDLAALRVEIIDAWHFMMSAAMAAGLDAESFSRLYYEKRQINLERAMSGQYSARNKQGKDDAHLGHLS